MKHLYILPSIHRITGSAILAFWPPVVLLILGANYQDFLKFMTPVKFWTWWLFLWATITTFTGFVNLVLAICGIEFGFIFGIIIILTQLATSGASYPIDAMPDFYKLGYILPYYHAVQGSRAVLLHSLPHQLDNAIICYMMWFVVFVLFYSSMCFGWVEGIQKMFSDFVGSKPEFEEDADIREERRKSFSQVSDTALPVNLSIFDPSLREDLMGVVKKGLVAEVILSAFMLITLFISVGSAWNPQKYYSNIHLALINNDGFNSAGKYSIGMSVSQALKVLQTSHPSIHFTIDTLTPESYTYDDVVKKVRTRHYWGVL